MYECYIPSLIIDPPTKWTFKLPLLVSYASSTGSNLCQIKLILDIASYGNGTYWEMLSSHISSFYQHLECGLNVARMPQYLCSILILGPAVNTQPLQGRAILPAKSG